MHHAIDEKAVCSAAPPQCRPEGPARALPRRGARAGERLAVLAAPALLLLAVPTAHADPPANDTPANATLVESPLPFTDVVDTTEAHYDAEEDSCFFSSHTVWYEFTAPEADRYLITTAGTGYATSIDVYTVFEDEPDFHLTCASGVDSWLTLDLQAGDTFLIQAGSAADPPPGPLHITFEPLEPLAVEVILDPTGTVDVQTGVATVTGTVQCTQDVGVEVQINLKQKVKGGQDALNASAFFTVECGGEFSQPLETFEGFFKAGKAVASGSFFACDIFGGGCVSENIESQVIQLSNKKQ